MSRLWIIAFLLLPLPSMARDRLLCSSLFETQIAPAVQKLLNEKRFQEAAWKANREGHIALRDSIEKHLKDLLLSDVVESLAPLNTGLTVSFIATLKSGVQAIFKPDPQHWPETEGLDVGASNTIAEVDAYRIEHAMNPLMVPVTVERTINGMSGSLQAFVKFENGNFPIADQIKMLIFDYLIQNFDRKEENTLISDGHLVAIDHGVSFQNRWFTRGRVAFPDVLKPENKEVLKEILYALQMSLTNEKIDAIMTGRHSTWVIRQLKARRDELIRKIQSKI